MPIIMIDPFSSSAPQPTNLGEVALRMFEILLQNNLKADSETAQRYARFIRVLNQVNEILKQVRQQCPEIKSAELADLLEGKGKDDWEAVMNYALVKQIRMIDINKPAGEMATDYSRETILRRISTGYDQTRSSLEKTPLVFPEESTS